MTTSNFPVRKAAVLGAGVMGAQIAAHLVNANVEVVLFELPARDGDPNGNVIKAIDGLKKLEPSPLATAARAVYIEPANYEQHLPLLQECDLVIEAIAERMDLKRSLYEKVAPHLSADAVIASNTSGLSINALAQAVPGGAAAALLRRAFLQSAALHVPGRVDRLCRDAATGAGPARGLPHHHAGQGRDPRQGHAQLHRQPRRRVLDPGRFPPHPAAAIGLRPGRRADRSAHRPAQERHLPHCRRGWPGHAGARGQHHEGDVARRSVAQVLRPAGLVSRPAGAGGARSEVRTWRVPQARQGHPGARPRRSATTACREPRPTRR